MADVDMYFCHCDYEPKECHDDLMPVCAEETAMSEQAREEYFCTVAKEAPAVSVATATLSPPAPIMKAPAPSRRKAAPVPAEAGPKRNFRAWAGLALGLLLAGLALSFPTWFNGALSDAPAQTRLTKNIEDVRPGERVYARLPEGMTAPPEVEVDPPQWRSVVLLAPKRDGSWAKVEGMRPLARLREQGAVVGGQVPVNVPECGIAGLADVVFIGPCPPVQPRLHPDDRLVLTTYKHLSAQGVDVYVEGQAKPIGPTANHRFWSADRQAFVRADALRPGEQLGGMDRPLRVMRVLPRPAPQAVYNLEVEGAHVYHVTGQGVLVHNSTPCPAEIPPVVYREGRANPGNLTPRPQDNGGLSTRGSLSNPVQPGTPGPLNGRAVLRPGQDYIAIDTSKLPPGSVKVDNNPPGHVTIQNVPPDVIKQAVLPKLPSGAGPEGSGKFP